jgi:hypothetical protein
VSAENKLHLFSFVPLTKCDLTLVDIRPMNQPVSTTNPELHLVDKQFLITNCHIFL